MVLLSFVAGWRDISQGKSATVLPPLICARLIKVRAIAFFAKYATATRQAHQYQKYQYFNVSSHKPFFDAITHS